MKRGRLLAFILIGCLAVVSGCIKNQPYVTTINPTLTADIGTYKFNSATVVPMTLDSQMHDSITGLIITGYTSDQTVPHDQIALFISKYKGTTGTYSIVQQQAGAYYWHSNIKSYAIGGIVSITHVNSNNIVGYFSFTTSDGISIQNGNFNVGRPDNP